MIFLVMWTVDTRNSDAALQITPLYELNLMICIKTL